MIERQTMTAQETADYLGVSKDLVYNMVKTGELPAVRIGRRILFRREALERWMQMQEMKGQTEVVSQTMKQRSGLSTVFRQ
ncbi:helix-turn-helix domain-containing protein [Pseudobacillus badius]|uniref:helix-turn-helix domain-containing protein n=1 Tax=Bacillus badius TaxID=1455 RepID=UPI001CBE799F|nr:helix-turn-helix domain-containing protein [Bacillus badius]